MKKSIVLSLMILLLGVGHAEAKNYTLETNFGNMPKPVQNSSINSNNGKVTDFSSAFCQGFNSGILGNSQNSSSLSGSGILLAGRDPYMIEINGIKYMLIKDNNDGIFDENDVLGINDTQNNIFASLKPLDTNRDLRLTGEELDKAGIRLVKINKNGKLDYLNKSNDFKNSDIEFIYLQELRKAYKNNGSTGQFGQYDVIIKNEKGEKTLVTGLVTFETKEQVKNYF